MKIRNQTMERRQALAAFTLVEVLVSTALLGIMFVTFYGGIAAGLQVVNLSRENLRANQIVIEKMETIRLYSWDQVNSNSFIPTTFTADFFPAVAGDTNRGTGIRFYGSLLITNANVDSAYSNSLKLVRVTLTWTNQHVARTRTMETMVSQYGMQNYIY